ncbi:agamous-like MADS-box protein AGL81 [Capsicum galapagoense]
MKKKASNFKKKKETIVKKTRELSVLCDVKVCAILVAPNGEVDTWPENPTELNPIIQSYKEHVVAGKRKVIDGGLFKNKSKSNNVALFCDNGDDDEWIKNLSRDSKQSLLVKLNTKLAAVEKRIEFLKMGSVISSSSRGKQVVANGDQLSSEKQVVGANQENYNVGCDEYWGSSFAINDDLLGKTSTAYNQERDIVMTSEFNCSAYNQDQEVGRSMGHEGQLMEEVGGSMGHEGQLMVTSNEMNMWENFEWDDVWSIINGPDLEFDLLTKGATGFGTSLNQQTIVNDGSNPNYDYFIPLSN